MEVVEHVDPPRLRARWSGPCSARPRPARWSSPPRTSSTTCATRRSRPARFRHRDHRFEWTRAEFAALGRAASRERYGYARRGSCRSAPTTPRSGRRPSWPCSPASSIEEVAGMTAVTAGADGARASREIAVPALSLVVLVGVSGSGKSTFGRAHFRPTEVISSATSAAGWSPTTRTTRPPPPDAFELLHYIVGQAAGRRPADRRRRHQRAARRPPQAGRAGPRARRAAGRDRARPARERSAPSATPAARTGTFGPHVLRRQRDQLRRGLRGLQREGFRTVHVLRGAGRGRRGHASPAPGSTTTCATRPGRSTSIGDVHGCRAELEPLLGELGYALARDERRARRSAPATPSGRRAVFVGDLVDRGPDTPGVLRLVMGMVADGDALCVSGQPRGQAAARAARPQRAAHARAGRSRWSSSAREPDGVPRRRSRRSSTG